MKIRLTKAAIHDLREIKAYIAAEGRDAADRVVLKLKQAVGLIAARPQIGRRGTATDIHEWSVTNLPYIVPYRIVGDTIEIVRIYHTSRQRPKEW